MIHVLIDSTVPLNIYLDGIKGQNRPGPKASAEVMAASWKGNIHGYITPTAYSNVIYFLNKFLSPGEARVKASDMLDSYDIIGQDESVFRDALASGWKDIEDAGQYEAARRNAAITHICTNNVDDYPVKNMKVLTPEELLMLL
ncbi:MAG: hypothetical protein JSS84_15010 [Bacteroidetes bacterium]|nr:hypothetical protein [Bacteroidota bacterium]